MRQAGGKRGNKSANRRRRRRHRLPCLSRWCLPVIARLVQVANDERAHKEDWASFLDGWIDQSSKCSFARRGLYLKIHTRTYTHTHTQSLIHCNMKLASVATIDQSINHHDVIRLSPSSSPAACDGLVKTTGKTENKIQQTIKRWSFHHDPRPANRERSWG